MDYKIFSRYMFGRYPTQAAVIRSLKAMVLDNFIDHMPHIEMCVGLSGSPAVLFRTYGQPVTVCSFVLDDDGHVKGVK